MNWRNPKNALPQDGQMVWIMLRPHKYKGNLLASAPSIEIVAGETYRPNSKDVRIENNDELGMGSISWVLKGEKSLYGEDAIAWLPVEEMIYPEWRE